MACIHRLLGENAQLERPNRPAMRADDQLLLAKMRAAGLVPSAVVIVATVRALKYHGGVALSNLNEPNVAAVEKGLANLEKHIESVQSFGVPAVVAINAFSADTTEEHLAIQQRCAALGVRAELTEGWAKGGDGAMALARAVVEVAKRPEALQFTYDLEDDLQTKATKVVNTIYGGDGVDFSAKALKQLQQFKAIGLDHLPICMAKTQKSLTDDEHVLGRPTGFRITVREFELAAGAGFIIPITGAMLRMPGLPAHPAAEHMSIDEHGVIDGLS